MTKDEFAALQPGDIIRHKHQSADHAMTVVERVGDTLVVMRTQRVDNPPEWDLIGYTSLRP